MMNTVVNKIKLHPRAKDFLFENFAPLRRIFSDVLGQLETTYIAMAFINSEDEIFFISSSPSIEQNLIEKELWQYDPSYQNNFIYQDQPKLWSQLSSFDYPELLRQYKQLNPKIAEGISIPVDYGNYRVIFSFGFREINPLISPNHHVKLLAVGLYCLNKINNTITFPDRKKNTNPPLKLIINNLGKL